MFASLLAVGLLQNIHGRSAVGAQRRVVEPWRLTPVR
jgi:hypothetical protein